MNDFKFPVILLTVDLDCGRPLCEQLAEEIRAKWQLIDDELLLRGNAFIKVEVENEQEERQS
jgi:hypothetical protein